MRSRSTANLGPPLYSPAATCGLDRIRNSQVPKPTSTATTSTPGTRNLGHRCADFALVLPLDFPLRFAIRRFLSLRFSKLTWCLEPHGLGRLVIDQSCAPYFVFSLRGFDLTQTSGRIRARSLLFPLHPPRTPLLGLAEQPRLPSRPGHRSWAGCALPRCRHVAGHSRSRTATHLRCTSQEGRAALFSLHPGLPGYTPHARLIA
jgi:hypothetical protein